MLATGCHRPEQGVRGEAEDFGPLARRIVAGKSVQGRPIEAVVFGHGPDVVLLIASIHGDEPAGTPLLHRLARHLTDHPELLEERRVVLVPRANPDGLAHGTRHNVRGVDLNRNYPADNYAHNSNHGERALSEPESVALHKLIRDHRPRRIVSFHQPVRRGSACIDYDGPAEGLAHAMAAACDLPIKKLGGRPGSLGSYAGLTLGTPIITVELPPEATHWTEATLWSRYGMLVLAAIGYPAPAAPMK